MPRWITVSQPLLLCLLTAWGGLLPVGWWLCHQRCEAAPVATEGPAVLSAAERRLNKAWAAPLLKAIEASARDALGSDAILEQGLPSSLVAEVRALVTARLRDQSSATVGVSATSHVDSAGKSDAPVGAKAGNSDTTDGAARPDGASGGGSAALAAACPNGRPSFPIAITKELTMPVLDGMGGKVAPAGKEAPNMSQNAWGVPMPNITVEVSPGKILTVDELVYGYDLVFEAMHLFSYVSWGRVAMQQDPADALAIADLISRLQPDCFVELGTNTGGGAIFYAEVMKQYQPKPLVVTIDVHPPTLNWDRFGQKVCPQCLPVTCHPTWHEKGLIEFVQGYTQEDSVVAKVDQLLTARQCKRTIVMHDSDHRGASVERDLQIYHKFVQPGSFLIVQDTKLSRMRGGRYQTLEAVQNFLATPAGKGHFAVDKTFEYLLFSHHHNGFMQRLMPESIGS